MIIYQHKFINFNKYMIPIQDINNWGTLHGICLYYLLNFSVNLNY